jgi:DNA topoisomerase-3
VRAAIEQFRAKFLYFVGKIARMDSLFEASFSPLSASGEWFPRHGIMLQAVWPLKLIL